MAERELRVIIQKARTRWSLRHVAIAHRIGVVPIEESSVEIAISSTHRREALAAVQFAIDELKAQVCASPLRQCASGVLTRCVPSFTAQVPIWKKEIYDGVAAEWKENKESSAPTVGQMAAAAHRRTATLCLAAAAALAIAGVARWKKL